MDRRAFLQAGVATGTVVAITGCLDELTGGDEFPSESVTTIVPFDEGGGSDVIMRQMADPLSEELDTSMEIVNVPGAGAMRGIGQLLNEDNDGHIIGKFNPLTTSIQAMISPPDFEMTDLDGVATVGYNAIVLIANADEGIEDLDDLIGRYEDGEYETVGGLGVHYLVQAVYFRDEYEMNWDRYIEYSGAGPINEAITGGEVPAAFTSDTGALSPVEAGDAEVIAVLLSDGTEVFPDAESVTDQGFEEIDFMGQVTRSIWAPDGTPEDRIDVLSDAFEQAIESETMQEWSEETGNPVEYGDSDAANEALDSVWDEIPDLIDIDELREEAGE
jgi:tripartite-type tricarboxylate transporter receptor subunit TctC